MQVAADPEDPNKHLGTPVALVVQRQQEEKVGRAAACRSQTVLI